MKTRKSPPNGGWRNLAIRSLARVGLTVKLRPTLAIDGRCQGFP